MNFSRIIRSSLNLKHIITIIAAAICFVAAMILYNADLYSLSKYSSFLCSREYSYSTLVDKELRQDSYAYFERKISFSTNRQLNEYVNCEVLMETDNLHTDNDFLYQFDVSSLNTNEVAISENIARSLNLSVGTRLYSKHVVENQVKEYVIKLILPEIYGTKKNDMNSSKGIVVLGTDYSYLDNIVVDHIFFYENDSSLINSSHANIVGDFVKIAEIKDLVGRKIAFYAIITTVIEIMVSSISFMILYAFNKNVYLLKKRTGNRDTSKYLLCHLIGYALASMVLTIITYLIISIILKFFYFPEIMILFVSTITPNLFLAPCFYKKIGKA